MRNAALNASAASDSQAEVVREDALPDQAGERGCSRMPAATKTADAPRRASQAQSTSSSAAASPSVPLDFFIR